MPMVTEQDRVGSPIKMTNEPVGPKGPGSKGSLGDTALMDAIAVVIVAWLILFLLMFSLRSHNI